MVELQGIGRDITDLKVADMEVEQRRKEVTDLTRIAILGELSGALAHELNQPLTAILSNARRPSACWRATRSIWPWWARFWTMS